MTKDIIAIYKIVTCLVKFFGFSSVDELVSYLAENPKAFEENAEGVKSALKGFNKKQIALVLDTSEAEETETNEKPVE